MQSSNSNSNNNNIIIFKYRKNTLTHTHIHTYNHTVIPIQFSITEYSSLCEPSFLFSLPSALSLHPLREEKNESNASPFQDEWAKECRVREQFLTNGGSVGKWHQWQPTKPSRNDPRQAQQTTQRRTAITTTCTRSFVHYRRVVYRRSKNIAIMNLNKWIVLPTALLAEIVADVQPSQQHQH